MDSKQTRKARVDHLLNELARSPSAGEQLIELLDLQYEDAKERLVEARDDEIAVIQGEARYLAKFSKQMAAASALLKRE